MAGEGWGIFPEKGEPIRQPAPAAQIDPKTGLPVDQQAQYNRPQLFAGYDEEDHPRDESGRWTSGGGVSDFPSGSRTATTSAGALKSASVKKMSPTAAEEILAYVGPGYDSINSDLYSKQPSASAKRLAKVVEAHSTSLPKGTVLYRGFNVADAAGQKFIDSLETGKIIKINGLQSTSFDPNVAVTWGGDKKSGGVIFEIKAKKGLYLESHLNKFLPDQGEDANSFGGEKEVLLPHGKKYKVESRLDKQKIGGKTVRIIQLREL